jgi:hypothetical protein
MRRTMLLLLLVATTSAALVANAAAATAPIVSPKADPYPTKGSVGFGQVKPREIFYGGDPTGLVCRIHWKSWGGSVARGSGVSLYVGSNQSVAQGHGATVNVVASKLGTWKGRPAYNRLVWSFPNHGRDRAAVCGSS